MDRSEEGSRITLHGMDCAFHLPRIDEEAGEDEKWNNHWNNQRAGSVRRWCSDSDDRSFRTKVYLRSSKEYRSIIFLTNSQCNHAAQNQNTLQDKIGSSIAVQICHPVNDSS